MENSYENEKNIIFIKMKGADEIRKVTPKDNNIVKLYWIIKIIHH